jgi:hypothetical protein
VPTAATYAIAKDPTLFRPAARTALALGLALGLATSLVLAVAVLLAPCWLAPVPPAFALLFAASAPAILANQIEGGVLLGGGRVGAWNALTIVNRGTMIASLGLLAIPPLRAIETVVAGLVVAETATLVFVVRTLARAGAGGVTLDRLLVRSLRRYGLSSWLHGMLVFAMLRVDNLLLGAMAGPGELGQYAAAGVAREMILFLPWVAGMLFLPKVAGSVDAHPPSGRGRPPPRRAASLRLRDGPWSTARAPSCSCSRAPSSTGSTTAFRRDPDRASRRRPCSPGSALPQEAPRPGPARWSCAALAWSSRWPATSSSSLAPARPAAWVAREAPRSTPRSRGARSSRHGAETGPVPSPAP